VVRIAGFRPSRKNPNFCARCCDALPPGGLEVDVAVLFADVRGSTALSERIGAAQFAALLNDFYRTATEVLIHHDAIIDKLIGDEVMALFLPGFAGPDYKERAASAGVELVRVLSLDHDLPVGAAVTAGTAYVGNVGDQVVDFTALGDPVNAASRLQAQAAAGEIVIASDLHPRLGTEFSDVEHRSIEVRGQHERIDVDVVRVVA
jgi:adenylate cyclase